MKTRAPYFVDEKPLHELLAGTAEIFSEKTAVITATGSLTYRELHERSTQLAKVLLDKNIAGGDIAGLMIERSAELVIAMMAVLKAGMGYLPIDPDYPQDRINYILSNSSAKMLIVSKRYAADVNHDTELLILEDALLESELLPAGDIDDIQVTGTDLAYILYTSGSTGKPKGVQITHYNLINLLQSIRKEPGITPNDKLLAISTISFDIAELEIYLPLLSGATLYIADSTAGRDGKRLLDLIKQEHITIMQATPFSWKIMLEAGWDEKLNLKVFCGGEPLAKDLAMRILPKCSELWNMYGPTETTIYSTIKRIKADDEVITIGRPIDNTQIYIANDDQELEPDGEAGEIIIGGDGVSPGYLNRPELTEEKFIDDKFTNEPGRKVYRTGDLGKILPNGELQHLGRIDRQVKIRGFRIETQEIEHQLREINDIRDAVIDARNDASGNLALIAYILPFEEVGDIRVEIQKWRGRLRETLPEYMVPQFFMVIEYIPLTPNGKIDYKALPAPDHSAIALMPYAAPRTTVEQKLIEIWQRYLGIDKIGIYDDFFDIGGHSLIAVEIMGAIQKEMGKKLPLSSLFQHSTVEKLALLLRLDGQSITWDSLVPIKPHGKKPPMYIVHGAGLHVLLFNTLAVNLAPDQPVFGLQAKGLNGIDEPFYTIEDMATHYVNEIVAQNPNGPYVLAGYSFGGLIAYEMAKQMLQLGKKIKMLAMFDTYAENAEHYDSKAQKLLKRGVHLGHQLGYLFKSLVRYPVSTVKHKYQSLRRRIMSIYWKRKFGGHHEQPGVFDYVHKIDMINERAEHEYVVKPLPVHIDLFKARRVMFYMKEPEFLGWKPFALNGVTIHTIPGDHDSIFTPPNDKEFARILQECLNDADKREN